MKNSKKPFERVTSKTFRFIKKDNLKGIKHLAGIILVTKPKHLTYQEYLVNFMNYYQLNEDTICDLFDKCTRGEIDRPVENGFDDEWRTLLKNITDEGPNKLIDIIREKM